MRRDKGPRHRGFTVKEGERREGPWDKILGERLDNSDGTEAKGVPFQDGMVSTVSDATGLTD